MIKKNIFQLRLVIANGFEIPAIYRKYNMSILVKNARFTGK